MMACASRKMRAIFEKNLGEFLRCMPSNVMGEFLRCRPFNLWRRYYCFTHNSACRHCTHTGRKITLTSNCTAWQRTYKSSCRDSEDVKALRAVQVCKDSVLFSLIVDKNTRSTVHRNIAPVTGSVCTLVGTFFLPVLERYVEIEQWCIEKVERVGTSWGVHTTGSDGQCPLGSAPFCVILRATKSRLLKYGPVVRLPTIRLELKQAYLRLDYDLGLMYKFQRKQHCARCKTKANVFESMGAVSCGLSVLCRACMTATFTTVLERTQQHQAACMRVLAQSHAVYEYTQVPAPMAVFGAPRELKSVLCARKGV